MGVFENLPYTNFHELNLDWIIEKLKNIEIPQESAERAEAAAETATEAASQAQTSAEAAASAALSQIARYNVLTRTTANQDVGTLAVGSHLYKSGYTVMGSVGYVLTSVPTRGTVIASGFPAPAGTSYTLVGHKMSSVEADRDHVVIARLFTGPPEQWPDTPWGSIYWWYGNITPGDEVFFDIAYITSEAIG